jgi:type II secretory pathway component PulJ
MGGVVDGGTATTTIAPMMRRRAATALLLSAAALAKLADELDDLQQQGRLTSEDRERFDELQARSAAMRMDYHQAVSRYRVVTGAA